jgi:hypothetical protein
MMALLIAVLLAFAGLVLDGGRLYFEKRKMQAAADAGAFAGAHEVKRGNTGRVDVAAKEDARLNSYEDGVGTIEVDVNNPPLSGEFQSNGFVEVIVQQEIPTYLMRILNFNQATVRARAVAGLLTYSDLCLLALDPDDRAALRVTGTPRLEAECGVMVNSDNDRAIEVNGTGELVSQWIGTAGQARTAGGGLMIPSIAEYALPMTDPFAARTEPVAAHYPLSPTAGLAAGTISTNTVLQPGLYPKQIKITGGTVTFLPGQYYLTRGLSARAPQTSRTSWIAPHSNADPRAISKYRRRSPSVAFPVAFSNIQRDRLRGTQQLFLRASMPSQPLAEAIRPTAVFDGSLVNVQSLVAEAH